MFDTDALSCEGCGAPLPPTESGDTAVCSHCGTAHVVGRRPWSLGRVPRSMAILIVIAVVLVAGVLLLARPSGVSPVADGDDDRPAPNAPAPLPAPAPAPAPSGLDAEAMANAAPGRWHILAMDLGDLSDFRALDHLPALLAACRVWSPDCELARLDLDHVRADGQLDMVGDDQADADYRFFSVSRQKANVELAQVTEELPPTGYRVWIQEGEVKAMLDTRSVALEPSRGTTAWQPLTSAGACDQGALVLAVRADESVPKRPFYSMRLDWRTPYSGYSAWLWDLDPGDMVWPDSCESWSIDAARRRAP